MSWSANPVISKDDAGIFSVYCPTWGSTEEEAKAAAEFVLKVLTSGKMHFVRKAPTAATEKDFKTKETVHRGIVRFGFKDEPGEEHILADFEGVSIGLEGAPSADATVEVQPLSVEGEVKTSE